MPPSGGAPAPAFAGIAAGVLFVAISLAEIRGVPLLGFRALPVLALAVVLGLVGSILLVHTAARRSGPPGGGRG